MSTTQEDLQETWAAKIAKLLRKAESTTPEEAKLLVGKAQELMTQYAIDEQMLAHAEGRQVQESIEEKVIKFTGIFMSVTKSLAFVVLRNNNCKGFYTQNKYSSPKSEDVHIFGFTSDLEAVELLTTSLQVQCVSAMTQWRQTSDDARFSKMESFKQRREFIIGFTNAVSIRLTAARKVGEQEAAKAEAARSNVSQAEASSSVALVVQDRKKQVYDWFDEHHSSGLRTVSRRYQSGGAAAREAGSTAGHRADLGAPRVGTRKSLGR